MLYLISLLSLASIILRTPNISAYRSKETSLKKKRVLLHSRNNLELFLNELKRASEIEENYLIAYVRTYHKKWEVVAATHSIKQRQH